MSDSDWSTIGNDELRLLRQQAKRYETLRTNPEGPWYFPRTIKGEDGNEHMIMPLVGDTALDGAIDEFNNEPWMKGFTK